MGARKKIPVSITFLPEELELINEYCTRKGILRNTFVRNACLFAMIFGDGVDKTKVPIKITGVNGNKKGLTEKEIKKVTEQIAAVTEEAKALPNDQVEQQDYKMTKKQEKRFINQMSQIKQLLAEKNSYNLK